MDSWCRPSFMERDMLFFLGGCGILLYTMLRRVSKHWDPVRAGQLPPDYPSPIPLLGHLIAMAWDSPAFLSHVISSFKGMPARLNLLITDFYVVSGRHNIKAVLREPDLHTRAYKSLAVQNILKMPKDTLALWLSDDSGVHVTPHPTSSIPAHLRIDYLHYSSVHKFLSGPGLKPFADRFTTNLITQLKDRTDLGDEWMLLPDLFLLVQEEFLTASLKAMCGDYLLSSCPSFVQDYWKFNTALYTLAKGYPRWMKPQAYHDRNQCLELLKKWHKLIRPYFNDINLEHADWNPYYGTEYMKFRHMAWSKMDAMGPDSAAAEDLGLIWAANGNSIPASFWMLAEVVCRPALLAEVLRVVESCRLDSEAEIRFDWTKLCNEPLLQSIYSETLRMKVASFILRSPDRKDFRLGRWLIPRDSNMLISGYNAQMDSEVWVIHENDRPVEEFWAERFLVYAEETATETIAKADTEIAESAAQGIRPESKFSLEGRSDSWLPYGGGQRMCPGRHFVKQEMIYGLAIMITLFDIELESKTGNLPHYDMNGFGFGALLPRGATPVRIRRSGRDRKYSMT